MKRDEILNLAATPEERLLVGQLWDKARLADQAGRLSGTKFLSPAETDFALRVCERAGFPAVPDGGYDGAERCVMLLLPAWVEPEDAVSAPDNPIAVLRLEPHGHTALSHRDYLGALMGAGIQREALGDILVQPDGAFVFCLSELTPYLLQNLTQAGRERLTVSLAERADAAAAAAAQDGEDLDATVMSLRLDAVLAVGFRMARETAKNAVLQGLCTVNHRAVNKPERTVSAGDLLSLRGYGRLRLEALSGETRKGRTRIRLVRFR